MLLSGLGASGASVRCEPAGWPQTQAATVTGQVENVRFVVRGGVVTVYDDRR